MNAQTVMMVVVGYVLCAILAGFAITVLVKIWTNDIDISAVLSEANGDASLSRLQLLIFTFVIAFSLFLLVEKNGSFPFISDGILTLLGISASTYAVSKGISYSREEGVTSEEERDKNRVVAATVARAKVNVAGAQAVSDVAGAQAMSDVANAQAASDVAKAKAVETIVNTGKKS